MAPKYFKDLNEQEQGEFFKDIDTVVTDCDGVLWITVNVIEGAPAVFNFLQEVGKRVYYITNNSTKTAEALKTKFTNMGFNATTENVIGTGQLAARYAKKHVNPSKRAFVIGSPGLSAELTRYGVNHFGIGQDPYVPNLPDSIEGIELENDVGAVIVGFDEHVGYTKMVKAATYLADPECLFIGTNRDNRFPVRNTRYVMPGTGSFVAAVETCSGRAATVVGKPEKFLMDIIKEEHELTPSRTLMIGDRCNTDILFGSRCGFKTLLVLSGTHSMKDVERYMASTDPDDQLSVPQYYTDSVADLLPALRRIYTK